MLHDEQLFAGVQARIGLYLLVGQRTKFLAAALGEEERAVDSYANVPQFSGGEGQLWFCCPFQ